MIEKYENKSIKLNAPLAGHGKGEVLKIPFAGGVPKSKYWRDRVKDAKIDGCVTVISNKKKSETA